MWVKFVGGTRDGKQVRLPPESIKPEISASAIGSTEEHTDIELYERVEDEGKFAVYKLKTNA